MIFRTAHAPPWQTLQLLPGLPGRGVSIIRGKWGNAVRHHYRPTLSRRGILSPCHILWTTPGHTSDFIHEQCFRSTCGALQETERRHSICCLEFEHLPRQRAVREDIRTLWANRDPDLLHILHNFTQLKIKFGIRSADQASEFLQA